MNTPTRLLSDIDEQVFKFALRQLRKAGYVTDNQRTKLVLSVEGYDRRYDGWSADLTPAQWDEILNLSEWSATERKMFELLRSKDNASLTDAEIDGCAVENDHVSEVGINRYFKRLGLPYHFTATIKTSRGIKLRMPRYRVFIRPPVTSRAR